MPEVLLTARAVAALLDVSTETVLRWTRRGDLPGIRLPSGQVRYRAAALDAWLTTHEVALENADGPAGNRAVEADTATGRKGDLRGT